MNDLIDIAGEVRGETEKAYRFFDGERTVWLPKSQCEWGMSAMGRWRCRSGWRATKN